MIKLKNWKVAKTSVMDLLQGMFNTMLKCTKMYKLCASFVVKIYEQGKILRIYEQGEISSFETKPQNPAKVVSINTSLSRIKDSRSYAVTKYYLV